MAIDQLLKRHFWVVVSGFTAATAGLHAQAVTQLVGVALAVDEKMLAAAPADGADKASSDAKHRKAKSAEAILSRNPFDSVTGSLNKPEPMEADPGEAVAAATPTYLDDPMSAPVCDGVKLLVIMASSDPQWSFAAMTVGGDNKSILRRKGGDAGGKTVVHVGWDRVWMMNGPQLCQAVMFKSGEGPTPPAAAKVESAPPPPPPPPSSGRSGAPSVPPDIAKGIVRVSPTEFNVDRAVVDKILENQADLMRQARIVPEQENGKTVGIRMFGVRPDTLLGVLGFQNGDRLQSINGFDIANPEKALEAYARLRTADHLTVQLNGRTLDYNIK